MERLGSYTPHRFQPDETEAIKAHLNEHGFAAVDALSTTETEDAYRAFWDWLESLNTGIDRSDPTTFTTEKFPHTMYGVIKTYGVGQAAFMWMVRSHPNVRLVFEGIWNTPDLLVSFDGAGMFPKPLASFPKRGGMWPHRDQRPDNQSMSCIQGLVNLVDNQDASDGGLVVFPGTHTIDWTKVYTDAKTCKSDWYKIPVTDPVVAPEKGVVLRGPPGTLFLWDSRTVHMNKPPVAPSTRVRAVAYICMVPKAWATRATLQKRIQYFESHRTTSHWPHRVKVNSDSPPFRGPPVPDPRVTMNGLKARGSPETTPVIRQLVGY